MGLVCRLSSHLLIFFLPLWETARYRLKFSRNRQNQNTQPTNDTCTKVYMNVTSPRLSEIIMPLRSAEDVEEYVATCKFAFPIRTRL